MATTEFTTSPAGPVARLVALAETGLARALAVWRARRNRRSVASLLEWDGRMLKDIGLTPGDVRSAMSGPAWQDPSNQLRALFGERRVGIRAAAWERAAGKRLTGRGI
ncbi:MAG: DUF1127 domain-containing protein [Bauldia sp.]